MSSSVRTIFIIVAILIVALAAGVALRFIQREDPAANVAAARSTVEAFGRYLRTVPKTEDVKALKQNIQQSYGEYVTPELLAKWSIDPSTAPGASAKGPIPDHIDVVSVSKQGSGYVVNGNVVMVPEKGHASSTAPVILMLQQQDGLWLIDVYQEQVPQRQ